MNRLGKRVTIELPDGRHMGRVVGETVMTEILDVDLYDGRRFHDVLPGFYTMHDADGAWRRYEAARDEYKRLHRPTWKGAA